MDRSCNDAIRDRVKVAAQHVRELLVLRPERVLHETPRDLDHQRRPALAAVPVRLKTVSTAESNEKLARPTVPQSKFVLDWWVDDFQVAESKLDARSCFRGGR